MKSWKFIPIAFVAGGIVGGITSTLVVSLNRTGSLPQETLPLEQGASGQPDAVKASLLRQIENQQKEIAALKSQLTATPEPEEPDAADAEEAGREARREFFQARMEERMNQRVDDMAAKLGLNEGQKQLLAEVYRQQFENFRARRNGEEVAAFNFDGAMEGILTPEQFEKYLETSQEEIYNRAELMATTQMVRLSQAVELSPEQEGLVYDAIHFTAQEAMISRQTGADYDMREVMNERLSTILTEDQLKTYQESGAGFGPGPGRGRGGFPGP